MRKMRFALFMLLLSVISVSYAQPLPRSTPEKEGVSSEAILQFVNAADEARKDGIEFHSFMVVRHGKVIAEGWWNPYAPQLKHTMYSVSKSFTATAIGFCVTEKKLSVEDKVISFFPDKLPDTISDNLKALRIRDLLSMSVGHEKEYTIDVVSSNDWIKTFLAKPIKYTPGTKFLYNTAATYILSAIVQKVTGEKVIDYLQPRLFKPLGISGIDFEIDPAGINTGGYGLRVKTEDMAKFGQLFLNRGKWNGKQIIPASWVDSASTKKIDQEPDATQARKDTNDWVQGYCYQMWRSRHNSYRGDGAFGQYILVWPEQDAVVITTAEVGNMQAEFNIIWDKLLPAFTGNALPANPKADAALKAKIASLALPVPVPGNSVLQQKLEHKTYRFESNDKLLKSLTFNMANGTCKLDMEYDTATFHIAFNAGKWAEDKTTRYGPYLLAGVKNNRIGQLPFRIAGAYSWQDENTLALQLRYLESPHTENIICKFNGDTVQVDFVSITNANQQRKTYEGKSPQ